MNTKLTKIKERCQELFGIEESKPRYLARLQPCGCIVCYCEDDERCHGCGAKVCGAHPAGALQNPVYVANPFVAALKSTIAAIDGHLNSGCCSEWDATLTDYVTEIINAWEGMYE